MQTHPICRTYCMKPGCNHGPIGPIGPDCKNTFTVDGNDDIVGYDYQRSEWRNCDPYTVTQTVESGPFFWKTRETQTVTTKRELVNVHHYKEPTNI